MSKVLPATAMTRSADYTRTYHHVTVSVDVSIEDVLRPSFWAHHTPRLNIGDLVDVLTADDRFDLQLRVTEKKIGMVMMRPLRIWTSDSAAASDDQADAEPLTVPEGYVVNHAPKTGWRALTKEPPLEISRNHKSRREATQAAIDHARLANGIAA